MESQNQVVVVENRRKLRIKVFQKCIDVLSFNPQVALLVFFYVPVCHLVYSSFELKQQHVLERF